jgi:hypothetical protein
LEWSSEFVSGQTSPLTISNRCVDLEKKIKEASAGGEHAWEGVGKEVALRVWRIEKFKVVAWPKSKYGKVSTLVMIDPPYELSWLTLISISSAVSQGRLVYRAKLVQEGPQEAQVVA